MPDIKVVRIDWEGRCIARGLTKIHDVIPADGAVIDDNV